ncbi:MAG TPA: cell envelope integrity protein CreD [Cyclobacteriaceae bacterium]|nr:cell envelope integrity protein CreD [Cyclobacteriaceae bacterium]
MENITLPPSSNLNVFERLNRWIQESIMVKLFSIGFLVLILLIPSSWIDDLIRERQSRSEQVMKEVEDKWSGSQILAGPILVIPFKKQEIIDRGKDGKEMREHIEKAYFLPETLGIDGTVNPEILHRGIFDAVVYESTLQIKSKFTKPDFKSLEIADDDIVWNAAYIIYGISDLRGINDNPTLLVGGNQYTAEPSNAIGVEILPSPRATDTNYNVSSEANASSGNGIILKLGWENAESFNGDVAIKLSLKGSRRLNFVPVGKTTDVTLAGPWKDPSFDGEFLPATREVSDSGFTASWKVLHFNRPFAQQWIEGKQYLRGSDFGVKLLIPVDQYQKSMRTSKYAQLIIILTFVALFLVEITRKVRIHPFQYILIGAALIIYYSLLLSISEQLGYNLAYWIAATATVVLISLYATTFLRNASLVILLSMLMIVFYSFIYVIILQQDLSLLIGSIGLFFIVAALMFFSRKVTWYKEAIG